MKNPTVAPSLPPVDQAVSVGSRLTPVTEPGVLDNPASATFPEPSGHPVPVAPGLAIMRAPNPPGEAQIGTTSHKGKAVTDLAPDTGSTTVGQRQAMAARPAPSPPHAPTSTSMPHGADDGSVDVDMVNPGIDPAPRAGTDATMNLPPPAVATTSPVDADIRPTMATLLSQQETIRRDKASVNEARRRVETPKPLAVDIEAIERQYASGQDWSLIALGIAHARPYQLPKAKFDMVIETGRALAKTSVHKILASLAGPDHGNSVLEELYKQFEIGQVSKMPGGNLRVKVKSREACVRLEHTKVNILGGVFTFKEFDILGDKYYVDIANIDSDMDTDMILHRLFLLGCKPVYGTFREVNMTTGITSATWRVYFQSRSCPQSLIINNCVCDQLVFDNKLHPVHGKNAPFSSERLPFGYRSLHALELGVPGEAFPPPGSDHAATQPDQHQPRTDAPAKGAKPFSSSLQLSIAKNKKNEAQLKHGAQHAHTPTMTTLVKARSNSLTLSLDTHDDSQGKISPPNSPKPQPTLLLTDGRDGFSTVTNKKKRTRNGIDFSNLLVKQQQQPLDGVATTNYFQVLQTMEVKFEAKNATAAKKYGPRCQVVPVDVKCSEVVKTSTASVFFVEKHHTKIKKAAKASPVLDVFESMQNDENTALLNTLPDCLSLADTQVEGVSKLIENATNPDHVIKKAVDSPMAFNSALSQKMAGGGNTIAELAQLHMINRVLCATQPNDDMTFTAKWKKFMKTKVMSKRNDMFTACAKWWTSSNQITELSRATKALGIFELMLMSIAPTIFNNDHWIQYITGQPVEWIPAHHARFLHPNTLLILLRSDLGAHCMSQWSSVQWQGFLLDDLEELRQLDGYYPVNESVLQLRMVDGEVVLIAGGLPTHY